MTGMVRVWSQPAYIWEDWDLKQDLHPLTSDWLSCWQLKGCFSGSTGHLWCVVTFQSDKPVKAAHFLLAEPPGDFDVSAGLRAGGPGYFYIARQSRQRRRQIVALAVLFQGLHYCSALNLALAEGGMREWEHKPSITLRMCFPPWRGAGMERYVHEKHLSHVVVFSYCKSHLLWSQLY